MKFENRVVVLCAEFNADVETVFVFLLALIVFDFYSFENLQKKNTNNESKSPNFLENHNEIQTKKNHDQNRVIIQFYICCVNFINIGP